VMAGCIGVVNDSPCHSANSGATGSYESRCCST
jgi:hypothetical protein